MFNKIRRKILICSVAFLALIVCSAFVVRGYTLVSVNAEKADSKQFLPSWRDVKRYQWTEKYIYVSAGFFLFY